jgi:hypothetical protein
VSLSVSTCRQQQLCCTCVWSERGSAREAVGSVGVVIAVGEKATPVDGIGDLISDECWAGS